MPAFQANWAFSEVVAGRIDEAVESARKAARLGPHLPQTHRALALTLALKGDMAGAKEAWADAMRVQPDFDIETYLPALARTFRDEEQFEPIRRGMRLASGAEVT